MSLIYSPTATATVAANTNSVAVSGMDLNAVLAGMVLNLGSRDRLTGDGYIIQSVTPTGTSGGTILTVGAIPTAFTNAAFIVDTRDFNGTAPNYLIAMYTQVLNTLLRLTSPLTNLLSGSRALALDKDSAGAVSRLLYAIGGRLWGSLEQRTLTYTPAGGAATPVETLALRAYPDGTIPSDALLIDLTTGGCDVQVASATMVLAATVDLASAPTGKVTIIGGGAAIYSFGVGKHKVREIHFQDDGAVLVHNAASLILPGKANILAAAGDTLRATSDAAGNWRVRSYTRADGTPLKGSANAAYLDPATGKLLAAQIPDALLGSIRYQGGWNASTNSPALPAPAAANRGWYYIVLTAGTTSQPGPTGAITDWQIGDWAVSDGTYWEKVDSSDQVISVAGLQGAITAANLKAVLAIGTADLVDASAIGRALIKAADAAAARGQLGLNSAGAVSFRNRIVNGNFGINQRAASGSQTAYAAGVYHADRWKAGSSGATLAVGVSSSFDGFLNISAGTVVQVIEGALYLTEGGTYTLSWAGTAQARVNGGAYAASPITVSGLAAWANATVEFGTGTLDLVQFEPGVAATTFEYRDDELRRCQRYYQPISAYTAIGQAIGATRIIITGSLPAPMRVLPSVTLIKTNVAAGSFELAIGGTWQTATLTLASALTKGTGFDLIVDGFSGLTPGATANWNIASDIVTLSAEL